MFSYQQDILRHTDHVEVGQSAEDGPVDGASLDTLDPQVVREQHAEDGNTLVVVGTSH